MLFESERSNFLRQAPDEKGNGRQLNAGSMPPTELGA
jgi:hypothetical protein